MDMNNSPSVERLTPWTLTQLVDALPADLSACTSEFERQNVMAFFRMDLRRSACQFRNTRRLSPGEIAILEDNGITLCEIGRK